MGSCLQQFWSMVATMNVLFVCTGNAFRSPVAEALLKKYKPEIEVDSAGTNPSIPISNSAKNYLLNENAQRFMKKNPESLNKKNVNDYDLIIAMKPEHMFQVLRKCPECKDRIVVWNIKDPYLRSIHESEEIFREIKRKVKKLIRNL
jgi:protein-tyrosine phosphatase